jgi:SM-20-related protein
VDIEGLAELITAALDATGWCVIDAALPDLLAQELALACAAAASGAFTPAGTGRRQGHHADIFVRSDAIRWLDASAAADRAYLDLMDGLRAALNRRLLLGLFDYECHYARYAPGAFYRRHVDAFGGSRNRVLSTVLYLNADWRQEEGGELLVYAEDQAEPLASVQPRHNRLVVFLSERFPHEVKPATRVRHSIAGWFRVRA